jgi:hypothetical protein
MGHLCNAQGFLMFWRPHHGIKALIHGLKSLVAGQHTLAHQRLQ